jgi:hypothetical protein
MWRDLGGRALGYEANGTTAAYKDGHERVDVKEARAKYVELLTRHWHRIIKHRAPESGKLTPREVLQALAGKKSHVFTAEQQTLLGVELRTGADGVQERPLLLLYHDESTFYCGDIHHHQVWGRIGTEKPTQARRKPGASLMVSGFFGAVHGVASWVVHKPADTGPTTTCGAKSETSTTATRTCSQQWTCGSC